jgi:exosortase
MTRRTLYFAFAMLVSTALYWTPLKTLVTVSFHSNVYPYTGVIPLLSACLIYLEKDRVFSRVRYGLGVGLALLLLALVIRWCSKRYSSALSPNDSLSIVTLSFVILWWGLFAVCYGKRTLQAGAFQLLFLLLMVPLPQVLLEKAIFFLQGCSSQAAGILFRLVGVPVFQDGFMFSLRGIDVEVAEQCSGIRSGLALSITSLLMGCIFLRSPWRRLWLFLAVFPVTIFKNGLRIVTICWLTVHPSLGSIVVWLHRYGGIPFSFLGVSLLAFLAALLRKFEETSPGDPWLSSGGLRFAKTRQAPPSN